MMLPKLYRSRKSAATARKLACKLPCARRACDLDEKLFLDERLLHEIVCAETASLRLRLQLVPNAVMTMTSVFGEALTRALAEPPTRRMSPIRRSVMTKS